MEQFNASCPNCGSNFMLRNLSCPECRLEMQGAIELPRLLRLSPEDREFIEVFVLSGGSLKEAGKVLDISYPTVRSRLDQVIGKIKNLDAIQEKERLGILQKIEKGEITAKEAVRLLRNDKEDSLQIKENSKPNKLK